MELSIDAEHRVSAWIAKGNPYLELDLSCMNLTELPPLPENVKTLWCFENKLEKLPSPLPASLVELYCGKNPLIELPSPLPKKLRLLNCSSTNLVRLPALPPDLRTLFVGRNKLVELPDLPDCLSDIDCSRNRLSVLPMDIPSRLDNYEFHSNLFRNIRKDESLDEFIHNIYVENEVESQTRTFLRTIAVKKELMEVAWAPTRPNFDWWFTHETGVAYT